MTNTLFKKYCTVYCIVPKGNLSDGWIDGWMDLINYYVREKFFDLRFVPIF